MEFAENPIKSRQKTSNVMERKSFIINNLQSKRLDPHPFLFELSMEEYIVEHPELLYLSEELGDAIINDCEMAKKYKRYDIVASYDNVNVTAIIETKKGLLDANALIQLQKYINLDEEDEQPLVADYKIGILVGTDIDKTIIPKIEKSNNLYAIVINRFDNGGDETVQTEIYSPSKTRKKDHTKYELKDLFGNWITNLNKRRLAQAIVRAYLEKNSNCTIKGLTKVFPNNRTAKNKLLLIRDARESLDKNLVSRYFPEKLSCADGDIYLCNQWGIRNISDMIEIAQKLGMEIIKK